ncbi:MAG: AMP-binding protein [Verrucomicrobiota bacterium]
MVSAPEIDLRNPRCFFPEQAHAFSKHFREAEERLKAQPSGQRGPGVLICARSPIKVLAQIAACVTHQVPAFLGNPDWGSTEWAQVNQCNAPSVPTFDGSSPSNPPHPRPAEKSIGKPPLTTDPIATLYIPTGGSSGKIKFAAHTVESLRSAAQALSHFFDDQPIHSWSHLPTYHVSGLMPWIRALVSEGKVIYSEESPKLAQFPKAGLKTTSIVGTQLARILIGSQKSYWGDYDAIFIGGSPVGRQLLEDARKNGLPLAPCYGSTETAAMITCLKPQEFLQGRINAGKPLPHAQVSIDPTKRIQVAAPSLFKGYWNEPVSKNHDNYTSDDLGSIDEAGYLEIHGRADRILISGGEKIDPSQVEGTIQSIAGVADTFVVGEAHPEWGQQIVCIIKMDDSDLSIPVLKEKLKAKLTSFKIPKKWILVDTMPYTVQGKRDSAQISTLLKTHA